MRQVLMSRADCLLAYLVSLINCNKYPNLYTINYTSGISLSVPATSAAMERPTSVPLDTSLVHGATDWPMLLARCNRDLLD